MSDVNDTLKDRGAVYGPYSLGIRTRAILLETVKIAYEEFHGKPMSQRQEGYFWDLFNKVSRLAISPDHPDSWHDIQGYAKLIEKDITGE